MAGVQAPRERAEHRRGLRVTLSPIDKFTDRKALPATLTLQCAPIEDFGPQYAWNYTDYDTIGFGTRTKPNNPALATVTVSSLFVDFPYRFTLWKPKPNDPANPIKMVQQLKLIGDSMTPFLLMAFQDSLWHTDYDVNMAATLRSLQPVERAGETDARYYTVSFTEFRGIDASLLQDAAASAAGSASGGKYRAILLVRNLPNGQRTMRELAKKYYKSAAAWRVIAKANGMSSVGGGVDLVVFCKVDPTRQIVIPALPKASPAVPTGGGGRTTAV